MAVKDSIKVEGEIKDEPEVKIETDDETSEVKIETGETEDEPETVIAIDGVSPAPEDEETAETPAWVKELRKSHRETQKRIRELEAENATLKPKPAIAAKPTLESCEYDESKFEAALTSWHENKRKLDEAEAKEQVKVRKLNEDYSTSLQAYHDEGKTLGVKDFSEAEEEAKAIFSTVQQAIIVKGSKSAAKVIYALGKNPELARKLASIEDHIAFAFEVARLEGKIVTKTKSPPKPETVIKTGGAPLTNAAEKQLEKLRADAFKSGDYTQVARFNRQLKKQQEARR